MNTLVIASSSKDYEELKKHNFIRGIREAFSADKVIWCNSAECMKQLSQEVDFILYFDSFKKLSYQQVVSLARASSTVDKILGVQFSDGRLWLYDKGIVANCIEPGGLVNAIQRALQVALKLPQIGSLLLAATLLILLTVMLASSAESNTEKAYAEPVPATQMQTQYDLTGNVIK